MLQVLDPHSNRRILWNKPEAPRQIVTRPPTRLSGLCLHSLALIFFHRQPFVKTSLYKCCFGLKTNRGSKTQKVGGIRYTWKAHQGGIAYAAFISTNLVKTGAFLASKDFKILKQTNLSGNLQTSVGQSPSFMASVWIKIGLYFQISNMHLINIPQSLILPVSIFWIFSNDSLSSKAK